MLRKALLCGSLLVAALHPARADDEFVASLRLRGGFDSNPQFSNGGGIGGSAFIGTDASMAAAHKDGDTSLGVAAEASQTQYANPQATPALSGTLIPGMAYVRGKFEVGASVNLSMRRYAQEFDVFGYRRDNERIQPFVFAKYVDKDFSVTGSLSQLRGTWHDPDFSNVKVLLYEGHLHWRRDALTLELTAWKRANETTFPISPITLDAAYIGKLSWAASPQLTLSAAAGYATTRYLDSPFDAQTATVAFGGSYDLGNDYALGLDLTYARGVLISGDTADALILSSSITKKFTPFAKTAAEKDKAGINRKI
jgi:hypothetical protein